MEVLEIVNDYTRRHIGLDNSDVLPESNLFVSIRRRSFNRKRWSSKTRGEGSPTF